MSNLEKNEIKAVDLFITEDCNLKCKYCYHTAYPSTLTVEQGKKTLDRLHEISPDSMKVTFFGGEPLLYPQTVLELAEYSRTLWDKKCGLHVSTNGTYFNEEMFKKYKELGFSLQVSFDGDEITQVGQRPCNFKEVVANIRNMKKIFPDLSCRMTMTPNSVLRLSINVKYIYEELGIFNIMHHATMESNWTNDVLKEYERQLNFVYHYRRILHKHRKLFNFMFIDKPLKILNDEIQSEDNFCEAGKSYLGIKPNGDVYPCHRAISHDIFKLGNIFEERPFIRGMFLTINKKSIGCQSCPAVSTCHSCPITHYKVTGSLETPLYENKYCEICTIENKLAKQYIPIESFDKLNSKIDKMAVVLVDIAEMLNEKEKT